MGTPKRMAPWFTVGLSTNVGFERYESNNAASSTSDNQGIYTNNPFMQVYNLLPYDSPYYYTFNDKGDIVFGDRANYYHYSGSTDPNYFNRKAFVGKRTNLTAMMTLYEQINPINGLTLRAQQNVNAYDYRTLHRLISFGTLRECRGIPLRRPAGDRLLRKGLRRFYLQGNP